VLRELGGAVRFGARLGVLEIALGTALQIALGTALEIALGTALEIALEIERAPRGASSAVLSSCMLESSDVAGSGGAESGGAESASAEASATCEALGKALGKVVVPPTAPASVS
jgi:hypothetical protein